VAEFLSPEWVRALDDVAHGSAVPLAGRPLTIEQVVYSGPAGDVRYQLRFADGEWSVVTGAPFPPDVVLVAHYVAARALYDGTTTAQDEFAHGRMKVRGHPDRLLDPALLATLDAASRRLRRDPEVA
jgi:hypothetical protein